MIHLNRICEFYCDTKIILKYIYIFIIIVNRPLDKDYGICAGAKRPRKKNRDSSATSFAVVVNKWQLDGSAGDGGDCGDDGD